MFNTFAEIQASMLQFMQVNQPAFQQFGMNFTLLVGAILLCWRGLDMMFAGRGLNQDMWGFIKLLLAISAVYGACAFYVSMIPGIGYSMRGLISEQGMWAFRVLDADVVERTSADLSALNSKFFPPSVFSVGPGLVYVVILVQILIAKALTIWVVAGGFIGESVIALLGPLFIPFILIPRMQWMAMNWAKAYIQFSFLPAVALAYLLIMESFIHRVVTTFPAEITPNMLATYGFEIGSIVLMFWVGILVFVPWILSSLFSGMTTHGGNIAAAVVTRIGR